MKSRFGEDFVAVVRISNLADETLAAPGERCTAVPVEALATLEADGDIRWEPLTREIAVPEFEEEEEG